MHKALDLFCGAGGMSLGAEMTGRIKVVIGVNHWPRAVESHSANFPDAEHLCMDAGRVDLYSLRKRHDIRYLLASPECTNHCRAKGGRPYSEQSRATAWEVVRYAEFLKPESVFVENVEEFMEWGPLDENGRLEIAMRVVAAAMEKGLDTSRLMIDAVILPVNVTQPTPGHVLETIRNVKVLSDPPPKTVLGLSNVSQGTQLRELLNRTYLVMALAAGMDAAIVDVLDTDLMDAMIAAEVLLNRAVYADDFLKAYRA